MNATILTLDKHYVPHRWVPTEEVIVLESKGLILDHLGEAIYVYNGGINAKTGERSHLETSSIVVVDGAPRARQYKAPVLTNSVLFQRDRCLCAYCGNLYKASELTRDHIVPTSKGGPDTWMNVVTSCRDCNALKGDMLQDEKLPHKQLGPQMTGKMHPLYVPYIPCKAEHMLLKNRAVKLDQMDFLLNLVKNKQSRIFQYAEDYKRKAA